MAGKSLAKIKKSIEKAISFNSKSKGSMFTDMYMNQQYGVTRLIKDDFELTKLAEHVQTALITKNQAIIVSSYQTAIRICYLLSYFPEVIQYGEPFEAYRKKYPGALSNAEASFYYALALAATVSPQNKKTHLKKIKHIYSFINRWATWYPPNFQHYVFLLDAELARIQNNTLQAMQSYNLAIQAAEKQNNLSVVGIANECAGNFYYNLKFPEISQRNFLHAYKAYKSWGALAKIKQLKKQHPEFYSALMGSDSVQTQTSSSSTALESIDVLSLMRATQIISDEIQLDKLLQKLLIILLQNAGADCATLITKESDKWFVRAQGTVSAQEITLTQLKPLETRVDIPLSLIRYTQRTSETIVVQDEHGFDAFIAEDPYLAEAKPKSSLVLPILYQNQLRGVLYLENKTTPHAFTPEHIHILQVLSSQAAISIENARLYYEATHDPLTGLANRNLLYQLFKVTSHQADHENMLIAILFFDLDGFKKINDTLGHNIGDQILFYIGEQIRLAIRDGDLAVRLGGDEFVAMLLNATPEQVAQIAQRFIDKLKEPIYLEGHEIHIGCSIGASFYPENSRDIAELLKQADIALYRVKASGKGTCQFYTPQEKEPLLSEDISPEIEIRNALDKNQFEVYYQPIFTAHTHKIIRLEALLRWHHPTRGLLPAADFILLAEETHLILPLGQWVLEQVGLQLKLWQESKAPLVPISLNISTLQLQKQPLDEAIAAVCQQNGIDKKYIGLEFRESMFIEDIEELLPNIGALKKLGIVLTVDDFGTYHSSLSYLRRFDITYIKIDKSFIQDVATSIKDQERVLSIIEIGRNLALKVVAEGVENAQQLAFVENNGADEIQGFYLGRPVNKEDCLKLLSSQNRRRTLDA